MHEDFAQRRRVALAVAITVILVPAAFLLNREAARRRPIPAGRSSARYGPGRRPRSTKRRRTAPVDDRPDGHDAHRVRRGHRATPGRRPGDDRDPARRPVDPWRGPASAGASPTRRRARSAISSTIPFDWATVTVTNLDNSLSVRCIANIGGVAPDDDVLLSAEAFLQIGDLTDAPLSVEITW